jgi:ABC-type Fe3+-hydroxamate transport system substrate-binding protein
MKITIAVGSAVAIPLAVVLAACSSQAAKPATTQTVTVTATETATYIATPTATITHQVQVKVPVPGPTKTVTKSVPQTYTTLGDGTYVVGTDIQPGIYKTAGPGSSGVPSQCYWAVLNSLNTTDIADNGNIDGPTTIQVNGKALELNGGCTWAKIG